MTGGRIVLAVYANRTTFRRCPCCKRGPVILDDATGKYWCERCGWLPAEHQAKRRAA
jgi:transposase